jgi:hypothetical protein
MSENNDFFEALRKTIIHAGKLEKDKAKLRVLLADILEWFNCAPISYANGNVENGVDEGEVLGNKLHKELVEKINSVLKETQ